MQGLTNGRIVHYVMRPNDYGPCEAKTDAHHRPAIVVEDWGNGTRPDPDQAVNLCVFPDGPKDGLTAPFFKQYIVYSNSKEPGTWHWPEKE